MCAPNPRNQSDLVSCICKIKSVINTTKAIFTSEVFKTEHLACDPLSYYMYHTLEQHNSNKSTTLIFTISIPL
jgi:hypothetical protein